MLNKIIKGHRIGGLIIIVHLIFCIKYGNLTPVAPIISHKELLLDSVG